MATIYRCDLCKKIFDRSKDLRSITLPHMNYHGNAFTDEEAGFDKDVCSHCATKLHAKVKEIQDAANVSPQEG